MKFIPVVLLLFSLGCDGSPRVSYAQAVQNAINKYPELNGCVAVYVQSRDSMYDIDMTVIRCNNSTTITKLSTQNADTTIVDDREEKK